MQRMKASAFAGPTLSLLLLSACDNSTGTGLGGDGELIGGYSVSGDRLIIHPAEGGDAYCDGNVLVRDTSVNEDDTTEFTLQGNRFRLLNRRDTVNATEPPYEMEAVVQRYFEYRRVSGSTGLEGRWQNAHAGYTVLSGAVGEEYKADMERRIEIQNRRSGYLVSEIEFGSGKIWVRQTGRFADLYLADWNGSFSGEPDDADSSYYDVTVQAVDKVTVRLKGNKTGETVTMRHEAPVGQRRYSSDNPAHLTYYSGDPIVNCPIDPTTRWFNYFLDENRKERISFKKGAFPGPEGLDSGENGRLPVFLP